MMRTAAQTEYARNWHKAKRLDPDYMAGRRAYENSTPRREKSAARKRGRYNADATHREQIKENVSTRTRLLRSTPDGWPKAALSQIRSRATKEGFAFDLTESDLAVPATCPILGVAFVFGGGRNHPHAPSVDRLNPTLGYVRGNVFIISFQANRVKNNCTNPETFRRIANYIEGHQ